MNKKILILFIYILLYFLSTNALAFQMPPISSSDIKQFQLWTVLKMNENGVKYINICTPLGNGLSVFRIHLNSNNTIGYDIVLNNPLVYYPDSINQAQAIIFVGNNQHLVQITNFFTGSTVISTLNLSQDFINQIKNQPFFTISFPVGPPFNISLSGFNQALKYALKLKKNL